jgi:CxxC-x17-CxxC domain-containing protein
VNVIAGGDAPQRPTFATVCSLCSAETQVPFRPDGVRPVFCLACLKRRTR